ncbi:MULTISPECIES: ABC transporter ATP-binding protein [Pontibacillus]|uniref:ABC transporter ATP-binding protein n=1 Tax=Pontibacillus chungwhensis TaxID=265426 RepID=A0ABY8V337_9BACI|nr:MULTISPECIES: ABC transporter ATP-binding protein [Pontibacillus]MCD5322386.1 ABC transporter ATP-binding protein [Pontibacillus sp. HN14]WIF99672.1 ABC transporter ATP-binding protein [Pontibacillus chungwhensis]
MNVIEAKGLTKTYNGQGGIREVTLDVEEGMVYGFLGPNGAGKSTFVRTMLGLLTPTSGEGKLLGEPIGTSKSRERVGYLPELFRYPDWLTGRKLLESHAELCKVPVRERKKRIEEVIDLVGMTGRDHKKIKGYSKGMAQRIGLACALMNDPKVIFLDEPTSALDPIGRKDVRDLMLHLRDQGKTVFLNSHLLNEVESVCDHVSIVHNSELIVQGKWRELMLVEAKVEITSSKDASLTSMEYPDFVHQVEAKEVIDGRSKAIYQLRKEDDIPKLVHYLGTHKLPIYEVTPVIPHLEDVFMYWVNEKEQSYVDDR